MPDHYDRLENRSQASRENALFRDLRHVLSMSKPRAPYLRSQLRGVDIAALVSRADLAQIPLVRRYEMLQAQAELPPLGGMNATRLGGLKQTFVGAGGLVSIGGQARDWWGTGRALFATGLRKGMLVLNCFSYDLVADGPMIEAGAIAIGANVIAAGAADIDRKVDAIVRLKPSFFCGRSEELKLILDRALDLDVDVSSLASAMVTGTSGKGLRAEYALRGLDVRHVYMSPELGAVAFECGSTAGMTVNEGLIVEVLDPVSKRPAAMGQQGEVVVTRINPDMPVLRYATGAWSCVLPSASGCGRTNMRIEIPHERTPEFIDMAGRRIHIADIVEVTRPFPAVRRASLVTRRQRDAEELHLRVEAGGGEPTLIEQLSEKFHLVTSLRGTIEILAPGTLSDDDAMIIDDRHLN